MGINTDIWLPYVFTVVNTMYWGCFVFEVPVLILMLCIIGRVCVCVCTCTCTYILHVCFPHVVLFEVNNMTYLRYNKE